MEDDRLLEFRDALVLQRASPVPGTARWKLALTDGMVAGVEDLASRAPEWSDCEDAQAVYIFAFEAGWLEAHRRLKIVLGFPEARGREAEASLLAMEPGLAFDEIAVRLRAAAATPGAARGDLNGNIISFRRLV